MVVYAEDILKAIQQGNEIAEEQKKVLEEIMELLKQQSKLLEQLNNNIATLSAKLEGFRLASELKQEQKPKVDFQVARDIARTIMSTLRASPNYKADINIFKQLFKDREAELNNAIEYLQKQGRIKIDGNWIILAKTPKQEEREAKEREKEERRRRIKEEFSG